MVSDIVLLKELPDSIKNSAHAFHKLHCRCDKESGSRGYEGGWL